MGDFPATNSAANILPENTFSTFSVKKPGSPLNSTDFSTGTRLEEPTIRNGPNSSKVLESKNCVSGILGLAARGKPFATRFSMRCNNERLIPCQTTLGQ